LLRAEGLADKTDSSEWLRTLDSVLDDGEAVERAGLRAERPPDVNNSGFTPARLRPEPTIGRDRISLTPVAWPSAAFAAS